MVEKLDITVSIVLFNEDLEELTNTINCFLSIPLNKKLYLIDNSQEQLVKGHFKHKEIEYIGVGKNIGFGAGHNVVLSKIKETSKFHLVLNPDVSFKPSVLPNLISALKKEDCVSMIAPKVLFPNGKHQYSCRRFPLISELLVRRFTFLQPLFSSTKFKGQYKDKDLNNPFFVEWVTGCFHLYKTSDFVALQGFDERYFLYMEDVDVCKRIDELSKKIIYYPNEEIVHVLKQGSSKNIKLFFRHATSAIKYFLKWRS